MGLCVVCQDTAAEFQPFWPGLKRCCQCGHCVADIDMQNLNLHTVYSESYFSGDEYENYQRDREVFEQQFKERVREVKKYQPSGTLIEIGCAYGFFLKVAQRDYQVQGFDIAAEPIRYAKEELGLNVYCEDFQNAAVALESTDVVTMWDTIEHLPRPDLFIDKAIQVLKPGGYLMLTTGDIGSLLARVQQGKWRLIHPPTHLHYFSRDTIVKLLESKGLHIVRLKYVGVRRSLRQIAYSLIVLGKRNPRLYQLLSDSRIGNFSFVLNTYDIMLVVSQKKNGE